MGSKTSVATSLIRYLTPVGISTLMEKLDSLTIAGDSKAKEFFGKNNNLSQ
jgi:hypothetical protein